MHSLQQKAHSLRDDIRGCSHEDKVQVGGLSEDSNAAGVLDQDYHLRTSLEDADLQPVGNTAYLGPGSSAQLIERMMKSAVDWHLTHGLQLPKQLTLNEASSLIQQQASQRSRSFLLTSEQRKSELHSLVPPSTQRAIIEHYLNVVSPEYDLLSAEQESTFLTYKNPLKWSSSNKEDPGAFALLIVFAVSTALVSRDLDANLSLVAMRCREELEKMSLRACSFRDEVESMRWTCKTICAQSICELISPTSRELWGMLGRAAAVMEQLRDELEIRDSSLGNDYQRLEISFLKLER